jgi:hypothetical protein
LAAMLGVSRQAVQARVRKGTIRAAKVNGAWQIPAVVAKALLDAERGKAVASGTVSELPLKAEATLGGQGSRRLDELVTLVAHLETRVHEAEANWAAQGRRFEVALGELRAQLRQKEADVRALQEERSRLRRAIAALVSEEGGLAGGEP